MKPKFWAYLTKLSFALPVVAVTAMSLVACQKNEDSPAPAAGYAATPQPCNAAAYTNTAYTNSGYNYGYNGGYNNGYNYPYNYNNTTWNPYYNNTYPTGTYPVNNQVNCNNNNLYYGNQQFNWSYGNWFWPNQWQPTGNNCGCPIGFMTVYSQAYGVACAPSTYGTNMYVVYWNYNMYGGPAQNSLPLNIPQMQYLGPSTNNACGQIAQGCDTRIQNCPTGSMCQAVGGGSTIGLCVRQ